MRFEKNLTQKVEDVMTVKLVTAGEGVTPAEALEYAYPLRVKKYSLRPNSGGEGKFRGGDGIVREIEVLTDCDVTLLADRRTRGPWGLSGAADGAPGKTFITRRDGSVEPMPGKFSTRLRKGERITIETPGGGGWGNACGRAALSGPRPAPNMSGLSPSTA